MSKKINTSDLVDLFASNYECEKRFADAFVKEFQRLLVEALERDGVVKVNGLGTFKLNRIAERKSVNVQTGEAIVIPEHYKVVFTADSVLKDAVNASESERTVDPLKRMAEQATQIKDILRDLGTSVGNETPSEEPVLETENPEEPAPQPEPEPKEDPQTSNTTHQPITREVDSEKQSVVPDKSQKAPKASSYVWLYCTIAAVLVIMSLAASYYFFQEEVSGWFDKVSGKGDVVVVEQPVAQPEQTLALEQESDTLFVAGKAIDYSKVMAREVIRKGTRLAYFAKQYYGHADFWIYLYEANQEVIDNPSNVLIGTEVVIPELPAALVDASDPKAVAYAIERAAMREE